jgi:hypothetical protein
MKKGKFSALPPRERFLISVITAVIIAAILVFAMFMGILIQEKIQRSANISNQRSNPVTAPLNDENGLISSSTSNALNFDSTNDLAPLIAPVISNTNSN